MSFSMSELGGTPQATPTQANPSSNSGGSFSMSDLAPAPAPIVSQPPVPEESAWQKFKRQAAETVGQLVPQAAAPVMKSISDALDKSEQYTQEKGAEAGRLPAETLSGIQNFGAYLPGRGPKPRMEDISETAKREHPVISGVGEGVGKFVGSMASPENVAIMAAMPEAEAYPILAKALSAGFAIQMSSGAKEQLQSLAQNWDSMTPQERAEAITSSGLQTAMAAATTMHAADKLRGVPTPESEKKPATTPAPSTPVDKTRTILRPTTKSIAGVEAPIPASAQDNPSAITRTAAALADKGAAQEFQKTQTAPAAQRQAVSTVGQVAEDKIAQHNALVNGDPRPEPITGTDTPSKFEDFDSIYKATHDAASKTYDKADQISNREIQEWQAKVKDAMDAEKELIARHNANIDDFNKNLAPGEEPMEKVQFDPSRVNVPEKPVTYNELKADLDKANRDSTSSDAVVRGEAFEKGIPKAKKAIDSWFRQHSDEIPPAEYESAKALYSDAERFGDIAQALRQPLKDGDITGNKMRQIESQMNKKAFRAGQSPDRFERLLGPDGYRNWRETAKLFDPVQGLKGGTWGSVALGFLAERVFGPLGAAVGVGAKASQWLLNKVLFDPEFGSFFKDVADYLKNSHPAAIASPLFQLPKELYARAQALVEKAKPVAKALYTNTRGEAGRNIPLTPEEEQAAAHHENGGSTFDMKGNNLGTPDFVDQRAALLPEKFYGKQGVPEPDTVYHGSDAKFRKFNRDYATEGGFFFSEDPEHARSFGKNLTAHKLKVNNPLVVEGTEIPEDHQVEDIERLVRQAQDEGKDSIYIKNFRDAGHVANTWMVFDPNKIERASAPKVQEASSQSYGKQPDADRNTQTYSSPSEGVHQVLTEGPNGTNRGYLFAKDVDGNPDAVRIASHGVEEASRGQGIGPSQIENLARNLNSGGKTTLLSDLQMTDAAKRAWDKVQAKFPNAVTKTPSGYIFDLNKLTPGAPEDTVGTAAGAKNDTALFQQAKAELGEGAPFSQIAQRAQELKTAPQPDLASKEIATRRPTSKSAGLTNNPTAKSDMAAIEQAAADNPSRMGGAGKKLMGYKEKLARTVADYTGINYTPEDLKNPDKVLKKFVNRVSDNLEYLYNQTPPEIRDVAKNWYDSAHTILGKMAKDYGVTHEQAVAVTAALSPQNAWDNNLGLAKRVMDVYKNRQDFDFTPAMEKRIADLKQDGEISKGFENLMNDVWGYKLSEVTDPDPDVQAVKRAIWIRLYDEAHGIPENDQYAPDGTVTGHSPDKKSWIGLDHVSKAVKVLDNGSVENIHNVMGQGHKIRNFYNNLINPNSPNGHVTIDTHATAAGLMQPLGAKDLETSHTFGNSLKGIPTPPKSASTGLQGTYPLYAEAYQRTAAKLGLQPRQLQSIVWEGIKSLMGDEKKTPELKARVKEIWQDVQDGKLTPAKARDIIKNESGGFSKPAWMPEEQWERAGEEGDDTSFDPEGGK